MQKITRKQDSINAGEQERERKTAVDVARKILAEFAAGERGYSALDIVSGPVLSYPLNRVAFTIATRTAKHSTFDYAVVARVSGDFTQVHACWFVMSWTDEDGTHSRGIFASLDARQGMVEWAKKATAFYRDALVDGMYDVETD